MGYELQTAIVGASGYAGQELTRILFAHPRVKRPLLLSARDEEGGGATTEIISPVDGSPVPVHPFSWHTIHQHGVDLIFLATPHDVSRAWVPEAVRRGLRVVDLSGAFRLKAAAAYPRWYGFEHHAGALLAEAVYGMTELNAAAIERAQFVANPGCYASSVILALAPLLQAGWVDVAAGIVSDSKSGASGAGRVPSDKLHFAEVNENCRAYSLFNHRHVPEMLQALRLEEAQFTFTPHLLPIIRGILSTVYVHLKPSMKPKTEADVESLFRDFYAQAPLVRVYGNGALPEIQAVAHTNYTDLGFALDAATGRLIVVSALDNLGKGAAGQAVQNMNLMFGFPQETALA